MLQWKNRYFQPPKVSGLSAGSDDQQITIQLGYDGCEQ
jgi:hypothetical protein